MHPASLLQRGLPLFGQIVLLIVGLAGLYVYPPARGRMLLVPLNGAARMTLVPLAVSGGARLIAVGPLAGSLLVEGRRDRLAGALLSHAIVPLAARAGGCEGGPA
ncbi:MAG: hypothetical protein PSY12_11770 [bacterium]|nr:hypothetical protein [bacterium]